MATVCQGIDPSVAAFIAHLTARQVDARPTDGAAAAEELSQLAAKLPLEAWQYRLHAEPIGGDHTDATAAALVGNIAEHGPADRRTCRCSNVQAVRTSVFGR